jgi:hypothetical protein
MIRGILDDRPRRVWAILIAMSVVAVTVGVVTIVIHDRIHRRDIAYCDFLLEFYCTLIIQPKNALPHKSRTSSAGTCDWRHVITG